MQKNPRCYLHVMVWKPRMGPFLLPADTLLPGYLNIQGSHSTPLERIPPFSPLFSLICNIFQQLLILEELKLKKNDHNSWICALVPPDPLYGTKVWLCVEKMQQ